MEGMKAVHPSIRVSNRKKRDEWKKRLLHALSLFLTTTTLFFPFFFSFFLIPISPRDLNTSTTLAVYSLCLVNALVWCLVNGSGISISCSGTHTQTRYTQPRERGEAANRNDKIPLTVLCCCAVATITRRSRAELSGASLFSFYFFIFFFHCVRVSVRYGSRVYPLSAENREPITIYSLPRCEEKTY